MLISLKPRILLQPYFAGKVAIKENLAKLDEYVMS